MLVRILYHNIDLGDEIGNAANNLIFKLAVSKKHLKKVNTVFAKELVNWGEIFNPSDPCESIYCLYIINALVKDSSDKELAELRHEPQIEERLALRLNILKSKTIEWSINYLKTLKKHTDNKSMISYTFFIVDLIHIYLVTSMKANGKLPTKLYFYRYPRDENSIDKHVLTSNSLVKFNREGRHRII